MNLLQVKQFLLFKKLTLFAAITPTMAQLSQQEEEICQHPNGYIEAPKPGERQMNVPLRCFKNANNKSQMDICGSLKLKKVAADIIQIKYEEDELEDWLFYLLWDKKYKTLAQQFGQASAQKQVELYFQFKQQCNDDYEAAWVAFQKKKND